jgi:glycosyltransferase involved in cell wall biosynthesis
MTPPAVRKATHAPIRVLQVVGNAIVGGMETWVLRLVERLPREWFKVAVLCPFESRFTDALRELGLEVLITPMPEELSWPSLQMTCAVVESQGIDVLHAHMPNAHLLAGIAGRLTGRPVLTTIHARQLATQDVQVQRLVGSHVSVVCRQTYYHALGLGIEASRLACIPNGVDTARFDPRGDGGARAGLRAAFGIADDRPLVGFVGRLSPEKGPEVFLHAVLLLHGVLPAAHFVLVGDGPLREELQQFVERFGLAEWTHFVGTREDMPAVHRELDVLVSSSHTEAMPLAVMEAMASGVPVVATHVGGVPDLIEQGRTGWLVGPRDFEGLADRAAHVLRTPGLRERMGAAARERAMGRFELADSVSRIAGLLADLAAPARRAGTISAVPSKLSSRIASATRAPG